MSPLEVSELAIYPVKSCAQIPVKQAYVEDFGLSQDRRWMVVDHNGKFITQRQQPRMCLIQPKLITASLNTPASYEHDIIIEGPGMDALRVTMPSDKISRYVTVWRDQCHVVDCGDVVAQWLSQFLEVKCRMVYFPPDEFRQVDLAFAQAGERTAFSDGFPILLISQASLDDLNSRMDAPIPMLRFRPNLVVSGCDSFAEDNWRRIKIGGLILRVVKPCSRCVIPSIDTRSAVKGIEPLRTLLTYRKRENKIYFGQNVIAMGRGKLAVGMPVDILE